MATKWVSVARGIRYREHATRKHGKRFDRYFSLAYWLNGKTVSEGIGWASEGITQAYCEDLLRTLKINQKEGVGPQTLKEMREANLEAQETEKKEKQKAASLTLPGIFFDGYLAYTEDEGKTQATIEKEKGRMTNYISPFFGSTSIYDIDVRMMDKFLSHLNEAKSKHTGKELSAQTKKHIINTISQIFNYAISRIDNAIKNPVQFIKKPSTQAAKRERHLTKQEAIILLEALAERSLNTHDMALLSLYCGLRAGEILSLTWGCINFDEKKLLLKNTKNKKNRHVDIIPEVERMLKLRRNGQKLTEKVFPNAEISKTFERTVSALGFNDGQLDRCDKVVFHTLRHTFASWLVSSGAPLHTVGKLLGHSSTAMTDRYSHLCPDSQKKATSILHGILDEPKAATSIPFSKAK